MFLLKGKELDSWHNDLELFLVFTRPGVVRSQKQEDLCELKVILVYNPSSRTPWLHRERFSFKNKQNQKALLILS